jgi:hypothetical protein
LPLLSGCAGDKTDFSAVKLLQGNLDLIYLGAYDSEYLELTNLTEEAAQTAHEEALLTEAGYFADYFDISQEKLSEATASRIVELYRSIYAKSRYETGTAAKEGESGNYSVELTIYPIDIMQKFMNEDSEALLADWQVKRDSGELAELSEDERNEAWAQDILELLEARLDTLGYLEPQTITVHISQNENGEYIINADDFENADRLIIKY